MINFFYILFFLSGFAALSIEIIWTRMLSLIFGSTLISLTIVLSVFMGGLSLGSYLSGRFYKNRNISNKHYALIEFLCGITVFVSPILIFIMRKLYVLIYHFTDANKIIIFVFNIIGSVIILLIPTVFMGSTLVIVTKLLSNKTDFNNKLPFLYAINTLGGMFGAFLTGFYFIENIGVLQTLFFDSSIYVIIGIGSFLINKQKIAEIDEEKKYSPGRLIIGAAFLSGFAAMAYEIFWTRILVFFIGGTVYTYTTILVVFLSGIFLGSYFLYFLYKRTQYVFIPFYAQIFIALLSILSLILIPFLPIIANFIINNNPTLLSSLFSKIITAAIIILPPAFFMGIALPSIMILYPQTEEYKIGHIYGINTLGNIIGSFSAGFILIPIWGILNGMRLLVILNIIAAFLIFLSINQKGKSYRTILWIILPLSLVLFVSYKPLIKYTSIYKELANPKLLYYEDGANASVSVIKDDMNDYYLFINMLEAGVISETRSNGFHNYLLSIGLIFPSLTGAENVLLTGLGSGTTLRAVGSFSFVKELICVEISKEVINAVKEELNPLLDNIATNSKTNIIIDDARNYLLGSKDKYDLIINDVYISALTGTSFLYSKEYFEEMKDNLSDKGCVGVGVGQVSGTDRIILKTLYSVFEYVYLFYLPSLNQYYAICSNNPMKFDKENIYKRSTQAKVLFDIISVSPKEVSVSYVCDKDLLRRFFDKYPVPINTDNLPKIDYHAIFWTELHKNVPFGDDAFNVFLRNNIRDIEKRRNFY